VDIGVILSIVACRSVEKAHVFQEIPHLASVRQRYAVQQGNPETHKKTQVPDVSTASPRAAEQNLRSPIAMRLSE
jgi:hypothetical protein